MACPFAHPAGRIPDFQPEHTTPERAHGFLIDGPRRATAPANRTAKPPATVTAPIGCAPEPGKSSQADAKSQFKATH